MNEKNATRATESGFTLVEALSAIVILAFGLMAVTNLLLVAASSNTVANQSSAATSSASEAMDALRSTPFTGLVAGGSLTVDTGPTAACRVTNFAATYNCNDDIPGVGLVHTRWAISPTLAVPFDPRILFIQVRSEGTGVLAQARSRAEFTTFRSCGSVGCPPAP